MHNLWAITEPNMKMMETVNFYKNMALLGAGFDDSIHSVSVGLQRLIKIRFNNKIEP